MRTHDVPDPFHRAARPRNDQVFPDPWPECLRPSSGSRILSLEDLFHRSRYPTASYYKTVKINQGGTIDCCLTSSERRGREITKKSGRQVMKCEH